MRYKNLRQKIICGKEQIEFLENLKKNIENDLKDIGVSEKVNNNYLTNCGKLIDKIKKDVLNDIKKSVSVMGNIYNIINELENTDYKIILIYKYIDLYTYEEIEEITHISRSNLFRYHKKALEELQPLISSKL